MRKLKSFPFFLSGILLIGILIVQPLAHASIYVGYNASNLGTNICGSNCLSVDGTHGIGEAIQNPFAGTAQLIQFGAYIGSHIPTTLIVLSFPAGQTPASTGYPCGSAGTCGASNTGQTWTVIDVESLVGLIGGQQFVTVTLGNTVTVAGGSWLAIEFLDTTQPGASGNIMFIGTGGLGTAVLETNFNFGTSNPSGTYTNTNTVGQAALIVGGSFLPSVGSVGTFTQCLGNCGSPAVTLVNTNSTHTINFNQSITLFYEFQSNVNGFLLNATTSVAQSYNTAGKTNQISIGVYLIASCPPGIAPFSQQCPGTLQKTQTAGAVPKGRVTVPGPLPVNNGQWIGIAVTATFSGMDLNDTNTSVPLFVTAGNGAGFLPQIIQQSNPFNSCSCKIGVWAWLNGNTVGGPPSTTPGAGFCDLTCSFITIIGLGFGTNLLAGGIFYWIIFFLLGCVAIYKLTEGALPAGAYVLYGVMLVFVFSAMGIFPVWVPIVIFLIVALMASGVLGNILTGRSSGSSKL